MLRIGTAILGGLAVAAAGMAQGQTPGPIFAVEPLVEMGEPVGGTPGRGLAELIVTDMVRLMTEGDAYRDCDPKMVEWLRRDDLKAEIEFQQSRFVDPATAVRPGQLVEPNILIGGTIAVSGGQAAITVALRSHPDGAPLHTVTGTVPLDQVFDHSAAISKLILDSSCPAGWTASGGGGGAGHGIVVTGTVASVTAPFRLTGAFPGGTADFLYTPASEAGGTVTYTLAGSGVTGAGTGSYALAPQADGTLRLDQTTTGCIDGIPNSCRTNTEVVILTPIPR